MGARLLKRLLRVFVVSASALFIAVEAATAKAFRSRILGGFQPGCGKPGMVWIPAFAGTMHGNGV
jgi:hypothetical protein